MNKLALVIVVALTLPLAAHATWTQHDVGPGLTNGNCVASGDLDNDGDMDMVAGVAGTLTWFENQGGTWQDHVLLDPIVISDVAVGDMDGDGDLDIVAMTNYPERIEWWENDNATFTLDYVATDFDNGYDLTLGDINADGLLDVIAVAWYSSTVAWFENTGSDYTCHELSTSPIHPHGVSVGDLDGNGTLDIAIASGYPNEVTWYENDGSGTFVRYDLPVNIDHGAAVLVVDADQDGDNDIAVTASDGDRVVVLLNDGNAVFLKKTLGDLERAWDVCAGSLGHDGEPGLAVVSREGYIACWQYDEGEFVQRWIESDFGSIMAVCMDDVDGDGDDDIIAISENDNGLAWWEQPDVLEPPEIELDIEPINAPIVVPQGGSFSYALSVVSNLQAPANVHLWAVAEALDQIYYVPDANVYFHITPNTEIDLTLTQDVPQTATPGNYEFRVKIGRSLLFPYFSDSFNVTVTEAATDGVGASSWAVSPWTETMFASGDGTVNGYRPTEFQVSEAWPNPFNSVTRFQFNLPENSQMTARVFDSLGRQVAELANGSYTVGSHEFSFESGDLASGVYFLQVNAGTEQALRKLVLLK